MHSDLRSRILQSLLNAAPDAFTSGAKLADDLDVSRVSIHNHLEALRAEGFAFEAVRNRGYRLTALPTQLHPALLNATLALAPSQLPGGLDCLDATESTNAVANRDLAAGRTAPFLVLANAQTAGRGRRGRVWHSPPGTNLYASFAFRPNLPPTRMQSITLWCGLQLAQALHAALDLPVRIKWPNDLMLNDRKLAGILTEARIDADHISELVIGIGLNVNATQSDFPPDLHAVATSLAIAAGQPLNTTEIARLLIRTTLEAVHTFIHHSTEAALLAAWPTFDFLHNRTISTQHLSGTAEGITSTGALRLRDPNGTLHLLHAGEVSLNHNKT